MQYNHIKSGMIVRVKYFKQDDMPEHWVVSMIAFSKEIYQIQEKYLSDGFLDKRVKIRDIRTGERITNYFFTPNDFEKVNTNA